MTSLHAALMPVAAATGLTPGGMAFLLLAWAGIIGAAAYCFYKIIKTQDRQR